MSERCSTPTSAIRPLATRNGPPLAVSSTLRPRGRLRRRPHALVHGTVFAVTARARRPGRRNGWATVRRNQLSCSQAKPWPGAALRWSPATGKPDDGVDHDGLRLGQSSCRRPPWRTKGLDLGPAARVAIEHWGRNSGACSRGLDGTSRLRGRRLLTSPSARMTSGSLRRSNLPSGDGDANGS